MNAYSYINNFVFVKLQPSKISGVGVFSIRDIPTSTYLFTPWVGTTGYHPISEDELKLLPTKLQHHIKDIFLYSPDFPKDKNTYVHLTNGCHWIFTTPYYFINSGFSKSNLDKDTMSTLRFVRDGEEILSNYGRYK